MNKAVPWNINGVGFDAREAAREAARRQGKSLGEWLDGVIADHASEMGVDEDDIGVQDRIAAVTAKLERLGSPSPAARPHVDRDRDAPSARERQARRERPAAPRDDVEDSDDRALSPRFRRPTSDDMIERLRDERLQDDRRGSRFKMPAADTELLLDEAIEAMERRTLRAERKTDKALASVARIIETTESKREDEREMFTALTRRLSDMETRIASRVADDSYRPIKGALARLEARLDTIGRRAPAEPIAAPPIQVAPAMQVAPAIVAPAVAAPPIPAAPALVAPIVVPPALVAPVVPPLIAAPAPAPAKDDEPIQRLEAKLNSILEAVNARLAPPAEERPVLAAPQPRPAEMPEPEATDRLAKRRLGEAIADIADRQRALESAASRRGGFVHGPARGPFRDGPFRDGSPAGQTSKRDHAADGVQNDIAALAAKVDDMRRDLLARADTPAAKDRAAETIEDLRAEIAGMATMIRDQARREQDQRDQDQRDQSQRDHSQRSQNQRDATAVPDMMAALDAMRRDLVKREDTKLAEVASRSDLAGLKAEIAGLSGSLSELAPRGTMTALEDAIRTLTTRIETFRESDAQGLQPSLEGIVGDLRASLSGFDTRDTIGVLEREVRTIGQKLDSLSGVDVAALGRLQDQAEEIRSMLTTATTKPLAVERIEQQVATLSEKLDRQGHASSADDQALQHATREIRALLANPPKNAHLDKIESRLEALAGKVDQAVEEAVGARRVAELSRRHFDTVQEQIAERLGSNTAGQATDMRSLENLVRDLAQKIEAVRSPDASHQAIEALQAQIMRLSTRFERTDGELSALPGIERSMHDLFAQLEDTRATVEAAAAKAAREAMETARGHGALLDPKAAREIAALKAIQEDADHRTNATLNAVHETLEKVVDRLSLMESDIASVRAPAKRPVAEPDRPAPDRPAPDRSVLDRAALDRAAPAARGQRPMIPDLMLGAADMLEEPLARAGRALDERDRRAETSDRRAPVMRDGVKKAGDRRGPAAGLRAADREDHTGHADFIAAARRAARAAQTDPTVIAMKRAETPGAASDVRAGLMAQSRDYVASHKKPVLLGIAALFVTLGTLAVVRSMPEDGHQILAGNVMPPVRTNLAAAAPPRIVTPAMPVVSQATSADLSPSALPRALTPASATLAGSDPITTGSIAHLPSFAAQPVASAPAASAPVAPTGMLKEMADAGDVAAEYEVGSRYADGRQMVKDFTLAAAWFEKAAQQGSAPAQYKLAALYEKGLGVPRDKAKARVWYQKAAEAGNPRAMHNLAVLVADGDGKPDYASALIWFRRAAEYGVHDSQYNLAILLARGLGTQQSLVQSYQWFAVAAQKDDTDAAAKRDQVASKLSPNDLAIARALATSFRPKTADVAATDIEPPAGGWDGAPPPSLVRSGRQKLSSL